MLNINNNYVIEQMNASHNVSKLSLSSSSFTPLKIFLKRNALDFHQYDIAKTFVLVDSKSSNESFTKKCTTTYWLQIFGR